MRDILLRADHTVEIRFRGLAAPVFLRPYVRSDIHVFEQVFYEGQYNLELGDIRQIVDAGANVGIFAIYMANRHPAARIIAIEPSEDNLRVLRKNTATYPNITVVAAALMDFMGAVRIVNPESEPWGFQVQAVVEGVGIPAVNMEGILAIVGESNIDILKLDIEGSERGVLQKSRPWIDRVAVLIIELHDEIIEGCTDALERAIIGQHFVRSELGENIVLRRRHFVGV